jgi:hypothetical protein
MTMAQTQRIALGAMGFLVLAGALTAQVDTPHPARELADFADSFNGRVCMEGRVTDENGAPMVGTTMRVTKYTFSVVEPDSSERETSDQLVDGSFRAMCSHCSGLDLVFFQKGYYHTTVSGRAQDQRVAGVECQDVAVVLEKKPVAVEVTHHAGRLVFDLGGRREVVVLGRKMTGGVKLGAGKSLDSLATPFVSLVGTVAPDGTLAHRRMPKVAQPGDWNAPSGVRLVFSSANDGVVLYVPQKHNPLVPGEVFREMREAPETGYVNQVEFESFGPYDDGEKLYFYCRVGGLYGKGFVLAPRFTRMATFDAIMSSISIRLNPDGSRNVTTIW